MDRARIERALERMAAEIVEQNRGVENVVLVGIRRRGIPLAERLAAVIERLEGTAPPVVAIDISFYRDDLSLIAPHPVVNESPLPADINGATVILVDDVLYTGKTIYAAVDHLFSVSEPNRVELAMLVDRGHRVIPFNARYVGMSLPTRSSEIVKVMLDDFDDVEQVLIVEVAPDAV